MSEVTVILICLILGLMEINNEEED